DTGQGIITHIWLTGTAADSTTNFKLYIDDTLIFSNTLQSFFQNAHGVLRPPFDSLYPGANVCDVQIPYRKNFKITYIGEGWNVYYAFAWRPVLYPLAVQAFQLSEPYSVAYRQQDAENLYEALPSPWLKDKPPLHFFDTLWILPGSTVVIKNMTGPAMIEKLKFSFAKYDFDVLDSLWLNIYWDGSPYPAVHVPVSDFFCSSNGGLNIHSFEIRADSSGLTSYFPMPFSLSAKIELVNNSKDSVGLLSSMDYSSEKIDRNSYGYFHAFFHEENPSRYHIYYDALHEKGKGKFVGLYLYCPHNNLGVVLEGAPIFTIDSNSSNYIHYTGGEDYYNSGWWFMGKLFSKPFAGHLNFFQAFYRFHHFDAIDFKKSIDLMYQPGKAIDVVAHYRTVSYYYKQPVSFWVSRDTIKAGERWTVSGTGYTPNSPINATFDSTQTIFTTASNANGEFNAVLIVPSSSVHGVRKLSINNEERPEPIYILASAAIHPIADSLPLTLRYRDSLLVTGTGFDPGERVQIYLDSILISDTAAIVGSDYRFFTTVRMPNIADWKYHLRAVGDHYNEATANDLITITRLLPFEFEDLVPWAIPDSGLVYYKSMSADWGNKWSQQAAAVFEAKGAHQQVTFKFYVPVSDTFYTRLFLTKGVKYGNFNYYIDGHYFGNLLGYSPDPYYSDFEIPSDTLKLGTLYFPKDTHTVVFYCTGKDSAAQGFHVGADLLLLVPTTKMALPKGVFTVPKGDSIKSLADSPGIMNNYIIAYPNPSTEGTLTLGVKSPPGGIPDGKLDVTLSDVTGRKVLWQYGIPIGENGGLTHFDIHALASGNYAAEFIIHSSGTTANYIRMVQIRE
ncbi:MAG: DUF2961 domain-containing protein, partial [Candidatus Kapaibacterium sp.]